MGGLVFAVFVDGRHVGQYMEGTAAAGIPGSLQLRRTRHSLTHCKNHEETFYDWISGLDKWMG